MVIYRLKKNEYGPFSEWVPKDVLSHTVQKGYYTFGAVDEEDFKAAGILQFALEGKAAVLKYLMVQKEMRREGAATLLLLKMEEVLAKSGISFIWAEVPKLKQFIPLSFFLKLYGFTDVF